MFNTNKFGGYLSRLRKNADMTQSELADRLNLTRQAVSRYETGDSFPDVSALVLIADIFGVSLDELINSGEPTRGESLILGSVAVGNDSVVAEDISDIVNLAPLLKPSVLSKLSEGFKKRGLDISNIVKLAEYLNDDSTVKLLENADFNAVPDDVIKELMPWLSIKTKYTLFEKILIGEVDWHLLGALIPYSGMPTSQVEEAVLEGALPWEALGLVNKALNEYKKNSDNTPF